MRTESEIIRKFNDNLAAQKDLCFDYLIGDSFVCEKCVAFRS